MLGLNRTEEKALSIFLEFYDEKNMAVMIERETEGFDFLHNNLQAVKSLESKGYIMLPISNMYFVRVELTEDGIYYFEDKEKIERGSRNMFTKLYGKEREIVLEISNMSDDEAINHLTEKYTERGALIIMNELNSLAEKDFVRGTVKSKTGTPGMKDVLGGLHLTVLPNCRNYLEMETDYMSRQKPPVTLNQNINNTGQMNNIPVFGDNNTISVTTMNNDIQEIAKLITTLKSEIENSDMSQDEKESVLDDLDVISEQVESDSPKQSRLKKAIAGIQTFVSGATKGATAATALVASAEALYQKLQPFIDNFVK